jgi:hypothetical protein
MLLNFLRTKCMPFLNKQERLSLASISSLVESLLVRSGAYPRVEHLSGASLGEAPSLSTNIRLGWKGLAGTNARAYYEKVVKRAIKSCITLTPGCLNILVMDRVRHTSIYLSLILFKSGIQHKGEYYERTRGNFLVQEWLSSYYL